MKNVIIILTATMLSIACDGSFQSSKIEGYCDEQYDAGYDDADMDNAGVIASQLDAIAQRDALIVELQAKVADLDERVREEVSKIQTPEFCQQDQDIYRAYDICRSQYDGLELRYRDIYHTVSYTRSDPRWDSWCEAGVFAEWICEAW